MSSLLYTSLGIRRPPKPPCWRDFIVSSSPKSINSDIVDVPDSSGRALGARSPVTDVVENSRAAASLPGNKPSRLARRPRARIHRTRSEHVIQAEDLPESPFTATLAETDPKGLRVRFPEGRLYVEENNRRCQNWLAGIEAAVPLDEVDYAVDKQSSVTQHKEAKHMRCESPSNKTTEESVTESSEHRQKATLLIYELQQEVNVEIPEESFVWDASKNDRCQSPGSDEEMSCVCKDTTSLEGYEKTSEIPECAHTASPTHSPGCLNGNAASPTHSPGCLNGNASSPTHCLVSPTCSHVSPTFVRASSTRSHVSPTSVRASQTRSHVSPTSIRTSSTRSHVSPTSVRASPTRSHVSPTSVRASSTRSHVSPTSVRVSPAHSPVSTTRNIGSPACSQVSSTRSPAFPIQSPISTRLSPVSPFSNPIPHTRHPVPPTHSPREPTDNALKVRHRDKHTNCENNSNICATQTAKCDEMTSDRKRHKLCCDYDQTDSSSGTDDSSKCHVTFSEQTENQPENTAIQDRNILPSESRLSLNNIHSRSSSSRRSTTPRLLSDSELWALNLSMCD